LDRQILILEIIDERTNRSFIADFAESIGRLQSDLWGPEFQVMYQVVNPIRRGWHHQNHQRRKIRLDLILITIPEKRRSRQTKSFSMLREPAPHIRPPRG
jgi:hypothetical protein